MSQQWPSGMNHSMGYKQPFNSLQRHAIEQHPYSTGKAIAPSQLKKLNHIEQLTRFFGLPETAITVNPSDDYDVEHYDLPDAFEGKNVAMRKIIIDTIKQTDLYATRYLCPLVENNSSLTVSWDAMHFNFHMLNRQPEEAVPRLVSMNKSSGQESMVRFGIGLMMEHGFYRTTMGQKCYLMHLIQISNAAEETFAYGTMVACIEHAPYFNRKLELYRQVISRSKTDLELLFQEEKARFAMAQKELYALTAINDDIDNVMLDRVQRTPDFIVYPKGMFTKMKYQVERTTAFISGRVGGPADEDTIKHEAFAGKTLFESRPYRNADQKIGHDPNFNIVEIGDTFHWSDKHVRDMDVRKYRTYMMDIMVFSRTPDSHVRLYFKDAVRFSGLYHWGGAYEMTNDIGKRYFTETRIGGAIRPSNIVSHGDYSAKVKVLQRQVEAIYHLSPEDRRNFIRFFGASLPKQQDLDSGPTGLSAASKSLNAAMDVSDKELKHSLQNNTGGSRHGQTWGSGRVGTQVQLSNGNGTTFDLDVDILKQWEDRRSNPLPKDGRSFDQAQEALLYTHLVSWYQDIKPDVDHAPPRYFSVMDDDIRGKNLRGNSSNEIEKELGTEHRWSLIEHMHRQINLCASGKVKFPFAYSLMNIAKGLLELDLDLAVRDLEAHEKDPAYDKTPYEEALVGHTVGFGLDAAALKSPALLKPGTATDLTQRFPINLWVSNGESGQTQTIQTPHPTGVFSLAANALPLFRFDKDDLKNMLQATTSDGYQVNIHWGDDAPSLPPSKYRLRAAKLQFASSVSAVFSFLAFIVNSLWKEDRTYAAEACAKDASAELWNGNGNVDRIIQSGCDWRKLVQKLNNLVAKKTDGYQQSDYAFLVQSFNKQRFLHTNYMFHTPLYAVRDIVIQLITKGSIESQIENLAASMESLILSLKRYLSSGAYELNPVSHVHSDHINMAVPFVPLLPDRSERKIMDESEQEPTAGRSSWANLRHRLAVFYSAHASPSDTARKELQSAHEQVVGIAGTLFTEMKFSPDEAKSFNENVNKYIAELAVCKCLLRSVYEEAVLVNMIRNALYVIHKLIIDKEERSREHHLIDLLLRNVETGVTALNGEVVQLLQKDRALENSVRKSFYEEIKKSLKQQYEYEHSIPPQERISGVSSYIALTEGDGGIRRAVYEGITKNKLLVRDVARFLAFDIAEFIYKYQLNERLGGILIKTPGDRLFDVLLKALYNTGFNINLLEAFNPFFENLGGEQRQIFERLTLTFLKQSIRAISYNLSVLDDRGQQNIIKYARSPIDKGVFDFLLKWGKEQGYWSGAPTDAQKKERNDEKKMERMIGRGGGGGGSGMDVSSPDESEVPDMVGDVQWTRAYIRRVLFSIPIEQGSFFRFCLDKHIPLSIAIMGIRPNGRYDMGDILTGVKGAAGSTWYGHANAMLADDAARKMHFMNFTIYNKCVITNPEYLLRVRNVHCRGYHGGQGHAFWDPTSKVQVLDYNNNRNMRDIFCMAVPADFNFNKTTFWDITGRFQQGLAADTETQSMTWYDSAHIYSDVWGWRQTNATNSEQLSIGSPKMNTLVFQARQFFYDPKTEDFTKKIDACDHWGDENYYSGATKVLRNIGTSVFKSASMANHMALVPGGFADRSVAAY